MIIYSWVCLKYELKRTLYHCDHRMHFQSVKYFV